jgi:UDP-N-acetylglucosamine transferase subunit ALG13
VIFVTVGTQLPFDRLVRTVDEWAAGQSVEVFAQMGPTAFRPRHIEGAEFVSPEECRRRMEEATAIVAHAGMGTIIGALELGKPLVIMPRKAALGEQRNDHQIATAKRFSELRKVSVAWDERELPERLDAMVKGVVVAAAGAEAGPMIGAHASPRLLAALRAFIDGKLEPAGAGLREAERESVSKSEARRMPV